MEGAVLFRVIATKADFSQAHLERVNLGQAHLEGASFREAHLEGANLNEAHLEGANLNKAHLEATTLSDAGYQRIQQVRGEYSVRVPQNLSPADLREAFFDTATILNEITLGSASRCASIADIHWGGVNLAVILWNQQRITRLGDEEEARQVQGKVGKPKDRPTRIRDWEAAVRAYRQLAVALRAQGMNEIADRFAYRAQICQRHLLRLQKRFGAYLWSGFLDLLAGYGYASVRTVFVYIAVILGFALAYMHFGVIDGHSFHVDEAIVYSLTSFHGRGFFPGSLKLDDPIVKIASGEAVIGLLIEISFIATFTQRFFSR